MTPFSAPLRVFFRALPRIRHVRGWLRHRANRVRHGGKSGLGTCHGFGAGVQVARALPPFDPDRSETRANILRLVHSLPKRFRVHDLRVLGPVGRRSLGHGRSVSGHGQKKKAKSDLPPAMAGREKAKSDWCSAMAGREKAKSDLPPAMARREEAKSDWRPAMAGSEEAMVWSGSQERPTPEDGLRPAGGSPIPGR